MHQRYKTLSFASPAPYVAQIALCRPESANALNAGMGKELAAVFTAIARKSAGFRVAVLTGEGKHFCAGADLKERQGMTKKAWEAQHAAFERGLKAIINCPIPVIAAVNGAAHGGGLELALACDFIVASQNARFGFPEAGLGIMPGLGGTQNFPRAVGTRRAKEWLLTAKPFTAEEAQHLGMVNHVYPHPTLLPETLALAHAIAANAPLSVRAIKASVNEGIARSLADALRGELAHYKTLLSTRDRQEGIRAWKEKRKPAFTGQ